MNRRDWLSSTAALAGSACMPTLIGGCDEAAGAPGCDPSTHPLPVNLPTYGAEAITGPANLFELGVVSGDPAFDRVIVWTRIAPATDGDYDVFYEVALDAAFERRVAAGTSRTDPSRDYTVKVDVTGLQPGTTYYYRFHAQNRTSRIGRMRTAPLGDVSRLRFAVMSCASLAHGYFHAYENVANRLDLDAVVHLGDYIYEYGTGEYGDVRPYEPSHEAITLEDYRMRYRQYRRDPKLQAVHAQHPFICVWDDHEVADNAYDGGAENHTEGVEGTFVDRLAAASQAYREYMPIREEVPGSIYRKLAYGDLVDLVMLDTRNEARSKQLFDLSLDDATRTMLGAAQEAWLASTLQASTARWVLLGQQVMVAPFVLDRINHVPFNKDGWDGYAMARGRLLDTLEAHAPGRTVILTGDIHSSWAADVCRNPYDPTSYDPVTQDGALAVEFVCPGVTSPGFSPGGNGEDIFGPVVLEASPHIKYGNFIWKGYFLLDVQADKVQADWYHLSTVTDETGAVETWAASAATYHGDPKVVLMSGPETERAACEPAPAG